MEIFLKELNVLNKLPNDSKVQLKAITILNDILTALKKLEKKKLTEVQVGLEESLYMYISCSRANNDMCNRYISFIFKHLFDFGLNSRLNDFISKLQSMISSSKSSSNVKCTALWLLGKVCCKSNFKSPGLVDLIHSLIKLIKNTADLSIKNECFNSLQRILTLKLPNFYNQTSDILKIILKQEKYFQNQNLCKKNILKSLDNVLFYLNQNTIVNYYEQIINLLHKAFEDDQLEISEYATTIYANFHSNKLFEQNIDLKMILRKSSGEPLKNFLEVLLYIGNFFNLKNDIHLDASLNLKISYLQIIKNLLQRNIHFINNSESLIVKVYDILISIFQLNYVDFNTNNQINYKQNFNNLNNGNGQCSIVQIKSQFHNQNKLNNEIEELFRNYIKVIYNSSYRKTLFKHIIKKLNDTQNFIDKMENSSNKEKKEEPKIQSPQKKSKNKEKEKEKEPVKFTEYHVNSLLISLVEYSENSHDLFEVL